MQGGNTVNNNVLPTLNSSVNSSRSLAQNEEKLYSVKEMAGYCNVSERTIKNAIGEKSISYRKIEGSSHRKLYSESDFEIIRNQLAKNQLNQGKNSITGKAAVKEVVSKSVENDFVTKNDLIAIIPEIISQTIKAILPTIQAQTPQIEVPKMDPRARVTMLVRKESVNKGIPFNQVYTILYTDYGYRTHTNPVKVASNKGIKTIDYIESIGKMETLAAVAEELFSK